MLDQARISQTELEQVLVRQFKLLKDLIALTKKERSFLLSDPDSVLTIVEDKEALLDSLMLAEDKCREIVQGLSLSFQLHSQETSIQALLPFFTPGDAERIKNLSEGISNIARQARELNRANQAIALTNLDWLKATPSFLIGIFLPDAGYQKPGGVTRRDAAGLGVEFRA
jgi:flagellar biosynthesis/type III secretory pathway chaperone